MNLFKMIKQKLRPTLTCERVNEFIVDYLEDRLPAPTRVSFEKHLRMCQKCTPFLEQYSQTISMLREDGKIDVPPDLAEHTMAFLRDHLDTK